jgi:hypothetical protein
LDEPYDNGSDPVWLGGTVAESDRTAIVSAVNLAPSLSAIARAAVARPWWRKDTYVFPTRYVCAVCGAVSLAPEGAAHEGLCRIVALDAAIDAAIDAAEGTV